MERLKSLFTNFYDSVENSSNVREKIVFLLFCISTVLLSFFHEPWFDEIQAWEISRESIYNILFFIPHYEGHPPLWHLILKIFSSLNLYPDLGIQIPNLFFMSIAVWLLVFKSPFPKIIRLCLPFTYFIFYQYSIISRPYSLFCLAIFLCAFLYKTKDTRPFRFVCVLMLLCLSSAYGMLFSAGITLCWLFEIWNKQKIGSFCQTFIKDNRFYAMIILLLFAIGLAIMIIPVPNVYSLYFWEDLLWWQKILAIFFCVPSDALFTDFLRVIDGGISPWHIGAFVITCLIGFLVNIILVYFFKKINKLWIFLIPYLFFLGFAFKYLQLHHFGLLLLFFIFAFWVVLPIQTEIKFSNKYKYIFSFGVVAFILIQFSWSVSAFITEIRFAYDTGKATYAYLKENNLLDRKIMFGWAEFTYWQHKKTKKVISEVEKNMLFGDKDMYEEKIYLDLNPSTIPITINTYAQKNLFCNYNIDAPERLYKLHLRISEEDAKLLKVRWAELCGKPDVIVKYKKNVLTLENKKVLTDEYKLLKTFYETYIWKNVVFNDVVQIYAREE